MVGFLLAEDDRGVPHVVLIRKNRPAWQVGKLNGVGGKVEEGETLGGAMTREFGEETGVWVQGWQPLATLEWEEGIVWFFRKWVAWDVLTKVRTTTDESVERHAVHRLNEPGPGLANVLPNLQWLVPLAAHRSDTYEVVNVRERSTTLRKVGRAG